MARIGMKVPEFTLLSLKLGEMVGLELMGEVLLQRSGEIIR